MKRSTDVRVRANAHRTRVRRGVRTRACEHALALHAVDVLHAHARSRVRTAHGRVRACMEGRACEPTGQHTRPFNARAHVSTSHDVCMLRVRTCVRA